MKYRNDLKKRILAGLLAGAALCLAAPAAQAANVIPNTQLPTGGQVMAGNVTLPDIVKPGGNPNGATSATITQNSQNAVIKWDSFNIGANATVTFQKGEGYTGSGNFNTLNYDISGSMSQIYGTINAQGGNIYIVNPAGVEIGNSAQINTGSLYVSNKYLDENQLSKFDGHNLPDLYDVTKNSDAVLMSLGNINANTVTFEGSRIVIDTERIKDVNGDNKLDAGDITIRTTNENNVVIGYKGYDEDNKSYDTKEVTYNVTKIDEKGNVIDDAAKVAGYMWVEDVEQLQAIGASADTLKGNYALRNSIDATATQDWNVVNGTAQGFASIGSVQNAFTGKFDGLDYNIFNLNINRADENNVGLFGVVGDNAVINNVTLVGGSITGKNNVGALAGSVQGGAHISNVTNSASVTGASNVGGIVGASVGTDENHTVYDGLINTGTIISSGTADGNGGTVSNAGGLIGYLEKGELGGASYNLGAVKGQTDENGNMTVGYNVGGLVGHAVNSVIGNEDTKDEGGNVIAEGTTIYNRLNVTGAYNVGGIVGNMEGTQVYNAENSGDVTATGSTSETYIYHTADTLYDTMNDKNDGLARVDVFVSNVGGIAGTSSASADGKKSEIKNATNLGNVNTSYTQKSDQTVDYYDAGNVGGIVGRAEDTDISNATNRENEIHGAHNVGGIAGYFGGSGTVTNGINDGGDIMATGARAVAGGTYNNAATTPVDDSAFYRYNVSDTGYALEHVRNGNTGRETVVVGNMGGIVGYMDGDDVYIASSANRGTVHSQEFTGTVPDSSKAANAGGIVGKIDRNSTTQDIKNDYSNAAVSNSYNTGDVRGYTGVGGIAGMMYNGEIAGSYNLGKVNTTRQPVSSSASAYETVNMGGIVGDTTEGTGASALLYDVYNKGQIGDETFQYYARHVGGIVGRLSGTVEKAYNTGAIYNGYNVVGGIAGWMAEGSIKNAFNTGNITVVDFENSTATSQVGGIVGGAWASKQLEIANVYNLGTLRAFKPENGGRISLGGIVGAIRGTGTVSIKNAYTTGNLYAAKQDADSKQYELAVSSVSDPVYVGSIWGQNENSATIDAVNTYYIKPAQTEDGGFKVWAGESYLFPVLGSVIDVDGNPKKIGEDNSNKAIDFDKKDNIVNGQYENQYTYTDKTGTHSLGFSTQNGGDVVIENGEDWRIYKGSTPILNAFLPNAEDYFDQYTDDDSLKGAGIGFIQYGTAYDPLLTIINANKDLSFNWQDLGINNDAGLAVYGAGLTLNDFMATGGSGYFAGLIYSDGALTLNAHTSDTTTGNVALGSASELYGSSVTIDADGQVTIYGSVTATGNGTTDENNPAEDNSGSISITGGNVDVYGQLTSAKNEEGENTVFVPGINGMAADWTPGKVNDPKEAMSDIGDRFGYTTGKSAVTGNISITATNAEDGHVNVYYGNKGEGIVTTGGDLTVTASGDIYMDSDLSIGGNLSLKAGDDSEAVLDISNIGKVQAANDDDASHTSNYYLNEFLTHFADGTHNITLGGDKTKLAVDMWGDGVFDLTKYDYDGHTLAERINALNLSVNGTKAKGQDYTYIWVSTGEQLAGIQDYKDKHQDSNILSYNFALKNDINASDVTDYVAIGTGFENGYTGTFDGRDNRIIGLTMTGNNAGIFDTIGTRTDDDGKIHTGTVEDLRVYSGTFSGANNAGAIAGVNEGNISNVTAFGNVVDVNNQTGNDSSYAGGIAGTNSGTIDSVTVTGTATQSSQVTAGSAEAAAGGIAGLNSGTISNSSANSAVNASAGNATALGGVAGVNKGTLDNVDSLGVTTGVYKVQGQNTLYSDNVGGIAGTNSGVVTNVYNESIVSGRDNVGGIFGENSGTDVSNVANAADVTGEAGDKDTSDYVGGLAGSNSGSITGGRNNGEITGNNYVGGLVGSNGTDSTLTNLVNDSAAAITGDNYVGGIAGSNAGTISAENQTNLINRGSITGQNYVGGVAGENIGTIEYVKSDINLNVRYKDQDAKYFGGVAGINGKATEGGTTINTGTITNATNTADIIAPDADFVGGIVGWNTSAGKLEGMGNSNEGRVEGASHVGGVAGLNDADIDGSQTEEGTVGIFNSGVVIAHKGGAGGIFGENTGAISHAELTNNGIVSGTYSDEAGENGTGGIFGVNSGDVTYSSLKNEIGGQVMGTQNVGGLIGVNSGNITGGRTEADNTDVGYYKYQIYNNGTIKAGTWDDADQDGVVDEGEFTEATTNSQNIAGLFGTNSGEVTAGYNTGAIEASGSTNVGGIAGTNAGKLDQVFNTVITVKEDGSTASGSITGHTNVGGIAGTNTGSISNAYNTTAVTGTAADAVSGSIAGTNSNTADDSIRNVYGTGTLVGSGSDSVSNDYDISDTSGNKDWKDSDSYTGFDFDGDDAVWKIYEGSTNPLLKVFLTQLTVNETAEINGQTVTLNDYLNLVYNGKEQDINIQDLIDKGFITGPDGMIKKDEDGNSVSAVSDAHKNTMKNDGTPDSALLYNTGNKKDAGDYYNWIASAQIAAGNDGNPNNLGYDIDFKDNEITIGKATIKVTLEDIYRIYGNSQMYTDKEHTTAANGYDSFWSLDTTTEVAGAADDLKNVSITVTSSSDGAVNNLEPGKTTTNNVGDYDWGVTVDISNISQNYQLEGAGNTATSHSFTGEGKSHVGKADLNITAGSDTIHVGGTPDFSDNTVDHFVNGDSFQLDFKLNDGSLIQQVGTHNDVVGFWYNGTFYGTQDAVNNATGLFGGNYNVKFTPGTLTVLALPEGMPDIPEIPGIENHWNGLLGDNPWDRNRDFRERKAEIHYIAGGMTL